MSASLSITTSRARLAAIEEYLRLREAQKVAEKAAAVAKEQATALQDRIGFALGEGVEEACGKYLLSWTTSSGSPGGIDLVDGRRVILDSINTMRLQDGTRLTRDMLAKTVSKSSAWRRLRVRETATARHAAKAA